MAHTLTELNNTLCSKVYEVYDVFKNFFGEDKVDLQGTPDDNALRVDLNLRGRKPIESQTDEEFQTSLEYLKDIYNRSSYPLILVYWPEVTVTNEYNKSIDIQELYAKVEINYDGKIPYEYHGFTLNRARYNKLQFMCNYMHSHICNIPVHDSWEFQNPCLGRGPIKETILSLKSDNDSVLWMLFCQELDMYVTVESIAGVPYHKLSNISDKKSKLSFSMSPYVSTAYLFDSALFNKYNEIVGHPLHDFTIYYLRNGHIRYRFCEGEFKLNMSVYEFKLDISNAFIDYINSRNEDINVPELYEYDILEDIVVADQEFWSLSRGIYSESDIHRYEGSNICTFKGQRVLLHIDNASVQDNCLTVVVFNNELTRLILTNILNIINFRYENKHGRNSENRSSTAGAADTGTYVQYL